ncbi:MAG: porphobilinogen synthase [Candidatus Aquicultor secundus]|uniref:Delta-aminolevulinic acid dehydratase n=1 Tax=Candidatus Aquicultor secundus TaxID=1973895 RepID=A0A2M7T758_9ACTN|nr:porphobilinogen synthase [Candidatus Aquicultor secundus]NCO65172.1 porphobilinogen synthase [Solirubrobacter sp.]OIO87137.1 MAG: delta-aminolevulinic acid dehydratase [Candidatus Aquicultor secundus]PIU27407.1 MAG: porphobilinogen synthase [Candidatus Aquicultor secundus]PIW22727.1 MAG: porphobilinogen synthase [Candidatus Aquicultor secundus]PIX52034.1 MAG: porphobilinogen synthase [Candidatus Aquicultor secundus]
MYFPTYRPRRLRKNENFRRMIRETHLSVDDFIYPLFVAPGEGVKKEISSMPGNYQMSIDNIIEEAREVRDLGIPAILLFGIPFAKDEVGSEAYDEDGIVQRAIRAIKKEVPDLLVVTDVCLCEYTSHGHCGIIRDGEVLNDVTLELLAQEALTHVAAGADMVAPSDMMDGRVSAIRSSLDENGHQDIPIMAYSAKHASAFYGPFREAAESTPQFGDRRSYQMDAANGLEALREVSLDIEEGADIVMVKPALSCLDLIYAIKKEFGYPTAAYNVSGEFSMVKAAAEKDWIDEKRVVMEILTGIKRAGADIIITYHAKDAAKWLQE